MKKYKKYLYEIYFLLGEDKKVVPFMVLVFIFSSMLDLLGIGLVAPYVSIVLSPNTFKSSKFYSLLVEYNLPTEITKVAILLGGILILVFALKVLTAYFINKMILSFSFNKIVKLRSQLMKSYQNLEYTDYLKRNSSEYIYSILNLTAIYAQGVLESVLRLISEAIVMMAIFALLLATSGLELLIFVVLVGFVFFSYNLLFRKKLVDYGRQADNEMKSLVKGIHEGIEGLKEVRVLKKEQYFYNKVVQASERICDVRVTAAIIKSLPRNLLEFVIVSFIVGLLVSAILMGRDIGEFTTVLGMFAVSAMRLIPSSNHIMAGIVSLGHNRNAVNLLYDDINNLSNCKFENWDSIQGVKEEFKSISLENVDYSYGGARVGALSSISIDIKAGESIGIIGSSGSGKSTLVDVLLGFLDPEKGRVVFNGETLTKSNLNKWLREVAYLPQSIFIIDDTLKRNVALGSNKNEIEESKVIASLKKSNLWGLVEDLNDGLETMLGERGTRLSGGQQQRVAIARAFYYGRDVLIMDEATSALDNQTETEIVEEIRRLKGEKTMVVIAHRLTTLKYCDRIYRLDRGKIVEVGTYEEVIVSKEEIAK